MALQGVECETPLKNLLRQLVRNQFRAIYGVVSNPCATYNFYIIRGLERGLEISLGQVSIRSYMRNVIRKLLCAKSF